MRPMPKKMREEMSALPEYQRGYCMYHKRKHGPGIKTEWHHNLIFAGRQVNEQWAILNICQPIHNRATEKEIRDELDRLMLNRASDRALKKYSKTEDLKAKRDKLNKYHEDKIDNAILYDASRSADTTF